MHECDYVTMKLYLWTLEFEFRIIFTLWNIIFILFCSLLKNLETIINSTAGFGMQTLVCQSLVWNFYLLDLFLDLLSKIDLSPLAEIFLLQCLIMIDKITKSFWQEKLCKNIKNHRTLIESMQHKSARVLKLDKVSVQ